MVVERVSILTEHIRQPTGNIYFFFQKINFLLLPAPFFRATLMQTQLIVALTVLNNICEQETETITIKRTLAHHECDLLIFN